MNIETINKWLDEEYGCSYSRLEELHDFYFEKYCDLKKENNQLKAELQLYQGGLKREHEAIHRVNDLEEENQKLKEVIDKLSYKIENYTTLNPTRIRQELLDILNEVL